MENVGAQQLLLNQILWNEQNNNNNNDNDPGNDVDDEEDREGDGTLDGGVAYCGGSGDEDKARSTLSTDMELVSFSDCVAAGT